MKTLKMRVIEKHWKECHDRPFRSFRGARWYEIQRMVYLGRWMKSKAMIKIRFPFARTMVDFSSGEPLAAVGRNSIVWEADWIGGL